MNKKKHHVETRLLVTLREPSKVGKKPQRVREWKTKKKTIVYEWEEKKTTEGSYEETKGEMGRGHWKSVSK